jgi:hypothetical protein
MCSRDAMVQEIVRFHTKSALINKIISDKSKHIYVDKTTAKKKL